MARGCRKGDKAWIEWQPAPGRDVASGDCSARAHDRTGDNLATRQNASDDEVDGCDSAHNAGSFGCRHGREAVVTCEESLAQIGSLDRIPRGHCFRHGEHRVTVADI